MGNSELPSITHRFDHDVDDSVRTFILLTSWSEKIALKESTIYTHPTTSYIIKNYSQREIKYGQL